MLILAMTFSGSVVFLAILLCAVLGKRVCSPAWVYNMLKLDLIFFCLPLPIYNSKFHCNRGRRRFPYKLSDIHNCDLGCLGMRVVAGNYQKLAQAM